MKSALLIPNAILERQDLPPHIKLVYGRVAILIAKSGSAVLTTDELARQCGISRRQTAKALPELVKLGLVIPHNSLSGSGLLRVFQSIKPIESEVKAESEEDIPNP